MEPLTPSEMRKLISQGDTKHVTDPDALNMLAKYKGHPFALRNACLIRARQNSSTSAKDDWLAIVNALAPLTKKEARVFLAKNTCDDKYRRFLRSDTPGW